MTLFGFYFGYTLKIKNFKLVDLFPTLGYGYLPGGRFCLGLYDFIDTLFVYLFWIYIENYAFSLLGLF